MLSGRPKVYQIGVYTRLFRRCTHRTDNTALVGFPQDTILNTHRYNVDSQPALSSREFDAAQMKVCMDPSKVGEAVAFVTSDNLPAYLELFNEPDFSYMGFTSLTSPQDGAAVLIHILQANITTQFLSPGVTYTNSNCLTRFNEACSRC